MTDESGSSNQGAVINQRRVTLFWVALFALVFVNLVFVELWSGWGRSLTAQPVALSIDQFECGADGLPSVVVLDRKGNTITISHGKERWLAEDLFVSAVRISIPRNLCEKITRVNVHIGDRLFAFSGAQFRHEWQEFSRDSSVATYFAPSSLWYERSSLPFLRNVINWPGDGKVLSEALRSSAWKFGLCVLLVLISLPFVPLFGRGRHLLPHPAPGGILLLCVLFALAFGATFLGTARFDDTVNPRGDAWEYQSMAVNAVKGHGINRLGGIEPFESYKFRTDERDTINYPVLMAKYGGVFWSYRTPGYSAFLAVVYSVVGVSPARAKQAQLLLLIIVSAFLPFVGYSYWKSPGFYGGIIAGLLFLAQWSHIADRLYTECLIVCTIFVFILGMLIYERKRTNMAVVLLGLVTGMALLVKGDLVFLPPLILALLAYQAWKKRIPRVHPFLFLIVCAFVVSLWSIYASRQAGQMVVLSTQGSEVLLDGNNERVWEDGEWHPEFRKRPIPTAFYNREDIKNLSAAQKVLRFYAAYPEKLFVALPLKLTAGFGHYPYLRIASVMILIVLARILSPNAGRQQTGSGPISKHPVARYSLLTAAVVLAMVSVPIMLLVLCCTVGFVAAKGMLSMFSFPLSFAIVFIDLVLITMVAFGDPRFISVIDFLFMLIAMTYMTLFLSRGPLSQSSV